MVSGAKARNGDVVVKTVQRVAKNFLSKNLKEIILVW